MALPSPGISTRTPPDTVCLILAFGIPNSGRLILLRAVVKTSALLLLLPGAIVIVIAALLGGLTVGLFFLLSFPDSLRAEIQSLEGFSSVPSEIVFLSSFCYLFPLPLELFSVLFLCAFQSPLTR